MKYPILIFFWLLLAVGAVGWGVRWQLDQRALNRNAPAAVPCPTDALLCPDGSSVARSGDSCEFAPCPEITMTPTEEKNNGIPINRADERVTKKPFGIWIDTESSPVQPERFQGYHTGTDFETFPDEAEADVAVRAICDGAVRMSRFVSGYGGVFVTDCELAGQPVTVLYGHLRLPNVRLSAERVQRGEVIGLLGTGGTAETDGERKHLHLSIHRGDALVLAGYSASKQNLDEWLDPCRFVACGR